MAPWHAICETGFSKGKIQNSRTFIAFLPAVETLFLEFDFYFFDFFVSVVSSTLVLKQTRSEIN